MLQGFRQESLSPMLRCQGTESGIFCMQRLTHTTLRFQTKCYILTYFSSQWCTSLQCAQTCSSIIGNHQICYRIRLYKKIVKGENSLQVKILQVSILLFHCKPTFKNRRHYLPLVWRGFPVETISSSRCIELESFTQILQ